MNFCPVDDQTLLSQLPVNLSMMIVSIFSANFLFVHQILVVLDAAGRVIDCCEQE
jgi:hypothetical protein